MGRGIACDVVGEPLRYFKRKNPPAWSTPDGPEGQAGAPTDGSYTQPRHISHAIPPSNNQRELKNRRISTIPFQNLKYTQGNCMRRCWGTTPISGEVGLTARPHPLRSAAPVTWRYTRSEWVHCLRIGCIAYGSGAMPTDRVHRTTLEHAPEESAAPARITHGQERTNPQEPHPQQRNTGSLATPHNPRTEPANPTPDTTRPRPVSRPRPRRYVRRKALSTAAPPTWRIRRSCPRGPRPRRGQPRGGRRGHGTASRTRSPSPRCGRSGSTAGRHRARHTRRA